MLTTKERVRGLEKKVIAYHASRERYLHDEEVYYVYALMDPRKPGPFVYSLDRTCDTLSFPFEPFYIGKGKRGRMFQHLTEADNGNSSEKCRRIRAIQRTSEVIVKRITSLTNEAKALSKEYLLIKSIGRLADDGPLTNKALGFHSSSGYRHTKEFKKRMSEIHKGRPLSTEHKAKLSCSKQGKTFSDSHRISLSEAKLGKTPAGIDTLRKIWSKKRARTEKRKILERKARIDGRTAMLKERNSSVVTCPHCGCAGQNIAMKRWHFDNCREKE